MTNVAAPPEGSILPETYQYERGEDRSAVLKRMMDARDEAHRATLERIGQEIGYGRAQQMLGEAWDAMLAVC